MVLQSFHSPQRWRTYQYAFPLALIFSETVDAGNYYASSHVEEYDYSILDPNTAYGTPYGGFSRATRSRLAGLPLYLPEISQDEADEDPLYMQMRNAEGQLFACRVYHESELDPESLKESVFEPPKFPVPTSTVNSDATAVSSSGKDDTTGVAPPDVIPEVTPQTGPPELDPSQTPDATSDSTAETTESETASSDRALSDTSESDTTASSDDAVSATQPETTIENEYPGLSGINIAPLANLIPEGEILLRVQQRLAALVGVCGQIHKGWWSYDWCSELHVSQFHVDYNIEKQEARITDTTKLGEFLHRMIQHDLSKAGPNEHAEDLPEVARVTDVFHNGALCEETGLPRTSYVSLKCCSPRVMNRRKGLLHQNGKPLEPGLAAIMDLTEDPERICTYNITVCTPLLCGSLDDDVEADATALARPKSPESVVPTGEESIMELIDRVLSNYCLQTLTGGWWTYEFCHRASIRQYHEALTSQQQSGKTFTTRNIVAEHKLGQFRADSVADISKENEWRFVVNATDLKKGASSRTYLELEYDDGDVCDTSDVTESAMVGGSGPIARSSSVRYHCGTSMGVTVNEDATCHYIVEVMMPALCYHPLFKVPVRKQQVLKCLPVEESYEDKLRY